MESAILNILKQAKDEHVTDIHLTLESEYGLIKFRKKGVMKNINTIDTGEYKRWINYLKFTAELDINEHKLPQSGKAHFELDEDTITVRISTLPISLMNEVIVIRILDAMESTDSKLLFHNQDCYAFLKSYMTQNQGLILFTGPTGSGKSTVMHRLIRETITNGDRHVISIEDPVEFEIDGMVQVEINEKAMLDYAPLLRGVLRCDPDIIMFGEIRDRKVADELIKASLSGHLVLSTFHSKSAKSTLSRLKDYEVLKEELIESLSLIINQRLIHTRTKSFIIFEYMQKEDIIRHLNGEKVSISALSDILKDLQEKGTLTHEEYKNYKEKFQ